MEIREYDGLSYKMFLSSELSTEEKLHFTKVINAVFEENRTEKDFDKKFVDNIYGNSIIVIVYDGTSPVAVRALWRNDLEGEKAYQPCDTAVCSSHRRRGIFEYMTTLALEWAGNAVIYNYPNSNSRRLYLKREWEINKQYYLRFLVTNSTYKKTNGDFIDKEYADWWFKGKEGIVRVKRGNSFYLARKRKNGIYIVIDEISKEYFSENSYPALKLGLLVYRSVTKPIYKTSCVYSVIRSENKGISVPLYKMDCI